MTKEEAIELASKLDGNQPVRLLIANQIETWGVTLEGAIEVGSIIDLLHQKSHSFLRGEWEVSSIDHLTDGFPTVHIVPME